MKFKLIDEWHKAYKFAVVQIAAISAGVIALGPVIIEGWRSMPEDMKVLLPQGISRWTSVAVLLLVILARIKKQKNVPGAVPDDTETK